METEVRYPLATSTWDQEEFDALQGVIDSGRFTMGQRVSKFESDFASFVGARFAVMVNSGSSANLLGLAAAMQSPHIRLHPGDEVIVPAVSWATTYYPISQCGLRPILVDVDLETLNVSLEAIEAAISPRTRAILAVNLLGNPADLLSIQSLCEARELLLLEDNCESLGATVNGQQTGTFGLFGTYSTFFSHHISTMEGGLVVTDDEYLYQAMISMRAHGWTRELAPENLIFPKTGDPFDDLFRFVLPGYNLRPLEMSGALGITQLRKLPGLLSTRRDNAAMFESEMRKLEDRIVFQRVGVNADSSWFGFSLILDAGLKGRRREVVRSLAAAGIECRPVVAGNFARNPVMDRLNAEVRGPLTSADSVHFDGLFVGNHHYPLDTEIALLREVMETIE